MKDNTLFDRIRRLAVHSLSKVGAVTPLLATVLAASLRIAVLIFRDAVFVARHPRELGAMIDAQPLRWKAVLLSLLLAIATGWAIHHV